MTAKDSADGVLGDIAAAGASAAHNIANFLLDGCGLTRAGADLQGLKNLGSEDGPIHVVERTSVPVSTGRPTHAGGASKQSRRLPKEDADKIKEKSGHIADPIYISLRWQLKFIYHNMPIFYSLGYFLYFTVSPF